MKRLIALLLLIISLGGCDTSENNKLKWFDTEEEAIEYGLKDESIKESDILKKVKRDGEVFIFFKQESAVSLANVTNEDNRYAWFRTSPNFHIGKSPRVEWDNSTYSGKKFRVIAGSIVEYEGIVITKAGSIVPEFNNELGIYYTIVRESEIK